MWASSSSSPMCASGLTRPAAISRMPAAKQNMRHVGTARPSAPRAWARKAYAVAATVTATS